MVDKKKNREINRKLRDLYSRVNDEFIIVHNRYFSDISIEQINEYGIIDEKKYDADDGILFVCKEEKGYGDWESAKKNHIIERMLDVTRNGLLPDSASDEGNPYVPGHHQRWYNIGLWAKLAKQILQNNDFNYSYILQRKESSITAIGDIAFTNLNKGPGNNQSGSEYRKLVQSKLIGEILREEIGIINPRIIVCCGTYKTICGHLQLKDGKDSKGRIYLDMPHPDASNSDKKMMERLSTLLDEGLGSFRLLLCYKFLPPINDAIAIDPECNGSQKMIIKSHVKTKTDPFVMIYGVEEAKVKEFICSVNEEVGRLNLLLSEERIQDHAFLQQKPILVFYSIESFSVFSIWIDEQQDWNKAVMPFISSEDGIKLISFLVQNEVEMPQ